MKIAASDIVLKALGLLLVAAAVLKGHELLTVPVANQDIWSWRPFLIFQVEFELALGIWLLSGVFKPLAWLTGLACFTLFCGVTLYKALTSAASCGCFGTVHVNPWITLFAIDLPAAILLLVLHPKGVFASLRRSVVLAFRLMRLSGRAIRRAARRSHSHAGVIMDRVVAGNISIGVLMTIAMIAVVLGATTPILALNEPAKATAQYEVLEPETWVGKELPILEYIDIADQLKTGTWLVLFYHYNCPDCARTIPAYERMARDLADSEELLRIAFVAIPPYGQGPMGQESQCVLGKLQESKEWFVTTPTVVLLVDTTVQSAWEDKAPEFEVILPLIVGVD